jgi:hypothetical protein
MATTLIQDYQGSERSPLVIERFLRDSDGVWRQIRLEYRLNELIVQMLANSAVALACYGLVMGSSHSFWQALASAAKLPVLFLLTLVICLPTLYLFNLLCGGRLSARQALALVLAAITVTSTLTLSFAPITLFFMVTMQSYYFFILLNTAILGLTGAFGLSFLVSGMQSMNDQSLAAIAEAPHSMLEIIDPQPASTSRPRQVSMNLLTIWLLLYGFVGTQLAWTLRPFHGDPTMPFMLFRPIEENFYIGVMETIMRLAQR